MTDTDPRAWPTEDTAAAASDHDLAVDSADAGVTAAAKLADVETDERGLPTEDAMRTALKAVIDPEIGINIVDLGLVYGVTAEPGKAHVEMTLTSMGCPLTELLHQQATLVMSRLPGIDDVDVNFVFSPPWSTDMISEDAKLELQAMGFNV